MRKRNPKDFESLFRQLQPRLFAYCCKYVEDRELARDIVQECFINLWENYELVETSFDRYLIIAVRNRCISHFRSLRLQAEYSELLRLKIKDFEFHPEIPEPLADIYLKEVNILLEKSIENLPEKCKQIFIMSRLQAKKNKEIANELNISIRTVEAQIYHALKLLKNELKDYLPIILLGSSFLH